MAKRKLVQRSKPRKRRAPAARAIARTVQHIANDAITRTRVPNNPPPTNPGYNGTVIVEVALIYDSTATTPTLSSGSLTLPGSVGYKGTTSWKISLTQTQIADLFTNQVFGVSAAAFSTSVFAVKKVLLWGPAIQQNARAELALTSGGVLVARHFDVGNNMSRPTVGLSVARPVWFAQDGAANAVNVEIGFSGNFSAPTVNSGLGTLHLSVMCHAQGILNDVAVTSGPRHQGLRH